MSKNDRAQGYFIKKKPSDGSYGTAKGGIAVGLGFKTTQPPTVTITGRNEIARKMKTIARRFGVPIKTDKLLAEQLIDLAVEDEIPEEMYEPVAELLISVEQGENKK